MDKRFKAMIVAVIIASVGVFIYLLLSSLYGSGFKKRRIYQEALEYVEERFPGEDLTVERCSYEYKTGEYFCHVTSTSSPDTYFKIYPDENEVLTDDYDWAVGLRQNTLERLTKELIDYLEEEFPSLYDGNFNLILASFHEEVPEEELRKIELDLPFDPAALPLGAGVSIWLETKGDVPSWEEFPERLKEVKEDLIVILPDLETVTVAIQEKYIEKDGTMQPLYYYTEYIVYDVPVDVIDEGSVEEFIEKQKNMPEGKEDEV